MPFKKLEVPPYPRRLWGLASFPADGKSTFAAQMRGPKLVIDADHRFDEVARLSPDTIYQLSDTPADHVLVERIDACLRENMPGSDVKTIIVDSLTAIIAPLVTQAIMDNDAGRNKNRMTAFKDKALAMRLLQDSTSMWGTDVLYIWHMQAGKDSDAKDVMTSSIPRTELARLMRSLNLQLHLINHNGKRGVCVEWARRGRAGMTLWDDTGKWEKMPERIEEAVYGGLSKAEQDKIEAGTPKSFPNPEAAIAWGFEQGCFDALQHASNAYDKLKADHHPEKAQDMWNLWLADVAQRKASQQDGTTDAGAAKQGELF